MKNSVWIVVSGQSYTTTGGDMWQETNGVYASEEMAIAKAHEQMGKWDIGINKCWEENGDYCWVASEYYVMVEQWEVQK